MSAWNPIGHSLNYMKNRKEDKNALGVPNQGIHSYRFLGIAIAAIFSYLTGASFLLTAAGLFLAGIALHRLFCVRTTVDTMLFPPV